jgi:hypothetical protein
MRQRRGTDQEAIDPLLCKAGKRGVDVVIGAGGKASICRPMLDAAVFRSVTTDGVIGWMAGSTSPGDAARSLDECAEVVTKRRWIREMLPLAFLDDVTAWVGLLLRTLRPLCLDTPASGFRPLPALSPSHR